MKMRSFFSIRTILITCILVLAFLTRILFINSVPPSPYWEEVALGYDAYSILKTGRDHHGNVFPIVAFESFGDYKPAGYFYAIVPFIALFGLSVLAVRIPSVLAGVAIVYLTGKIAGELFTQQPNKKNTFATIFVRPDILTMLLITFSPWAIQFSRGGWEANLATSLLVAGIYTGLLGIKSLSLPGREKKVLMYYVGTIILCVLSAYTYHSTRVIAPLIGIVLALPLLLKWKQFKREIVLFGCISIMMMAPLLMSFRDPDITRRLQETSAFSTQNEVNESNQYIQQFGSNPIAKLVFHRYWFYARTFTVNFLSHFNLEFLFLRGDENTRHSTHFFGLLFPLDSILLISGTVFVLTHWRKKYHLLWVWLVVGIIPSAITKDGPHALRTLPIMPVYLLMLGVGATYLYQLIHTRWYSKVLNILIVVSYLSQIVIFGHYYLYIYPKEASKEWQYGYQQMVESINTNMLPNEKIYITTDYKRPAMYYWFFSKTDPTLVQAENNTAQKDQSEFKNFRQFEFVFSLTGSEKGLIASKPEQRARFGNATELRVVNDLEGQPLWVIYRIE